MARPPQGWPEGLDKIDEIFHIMHHKLQLSHLCSMKQLGEMRAQTIVSRLEKYRKQLTPRNAATIFTLWVKERSFKLSESYRDIAVPYCTCLQSFGYDERDIVSLWDSCSSDEFYIKVDGRLPSPQFEKYQSRIRQTIQEYYLDKRSAPTPERKRKSRKTKDSKSEVTNTLARQTAAVKTTLKEGLPLTSVQTERRKAEHIKQEPGSSTSNYTTRTQTTFMKPPLPPQPPQQPLQPLTSTSAGQLSDLFLKPRETHLLDFVDESGICDSEGADQSRTFEAAEEPEENMRPKHPKWSYVCRNCNHHGHWTDQCPTRDGYQDTHRPSFSYECYNCGMIGDHFTQSCPDKSPGYWINKKRAGTLHSEHYFDDQRNYRLDSKGGHGRRFDWGPEPGPSQGDFRSASQGHVRKRSDERDFYEERSKRPRIEPKSEPKSAQKADNPNLVPLRGALREPSPSDTRLIPWRQTEPQPEDTENTELMHPESVDSQPKTSHSRGDRIAELESQSFLTELENEQEAQPPTTAFGTLVELSDPFVEAIDAIDRGDCEQDRACLSCSEEGEVHSDEEEDDDDHHVPTTELDVFSSSPITPRAPAPIEFGITAKSLYQQPLYHPAVFALFHRWTNVWIQKASRPVALDYWTVADEVDGMGSSENDVLMPTNE